MNIKKCFASQLLLLFLCGCGVKVPYYIPKYLAPLQKETAHYEKTIDNVTVRIRKFDIQDNKELFGRQGKNLSNTNKKIYPLQLTISNHSDRTWILDRHNIELTLMNKREIAEKLFVTDTNNALFYSALGMGTSLILFGAGLGCMLAGKYAAAYATKTIFYTGVGLTTVSAFPAALSESHNKHYSQAVYDTNNLIFDDIERKTVPFTCTMHPNVMLNALMFVKAKDWAPEFAITLLDQSDESKMLKFDVHMQLKK